MSASPADRLKNIQKQTENIGGKAITEKAEKPSGNKKGKSRAKSVHVRLTEDEYNAIEDAADSHGLAMSGFIRLAVREKLGLVR